ncbi:hypothetical protein C8R44DRAFT_865293 [Mycena epipterygia]|nr:hypothetical protein C8R44DRAFT_865293 [Mycena epipterygia]
MQSIRYLLLATLVACAALAGASPPTAALTNHPDHNDDHSTSHHFPYPYNDDHSPSHNCPYDHISCIACDHMFYLHHPAFVT